MLSRRGLDILWAPRAVTRSRPRARPRAADSPPPMTSHRIAAALALAMAVAFGVTAWLWRTSAVGGSDSACYALMARVFADGRLQPTSALALSAPWPDATRVAAPAGFLPSTSTPGAAVPVCAPGYALLLAMFVRVGGPGAVHVVPPLAAAWLVWLAFLLARRLYSPWAGVGAAALAAANPVVFFQAVQPMNDIATAALWLAAALAAIAARPLRTGALVGLGLLVRPNLAPAGVAAVLACAWMTAQPFAAARWSRAVRAGLLAGTAAAPAVGAALALNAALYGSALQSGYGRLGDLFAMAHVPVNLAHYARTWTATASPLVLLAGAAPWLVSRHRRIEVWCLVALSLSLSAVYLAYRPFPEWWYLRFLLPPVVLSLVLASVATFAIADRARASLAVPIGLVAIATAAVWALRTDQAREAAGLWRLESRFRRTAEVVAARLPPETVAIAVWQSGGLGFWPGSEVLVWDALDPAWLDRAVAWLAAQRRPVAIVVEQWEEEAFRQRFAGQEYGALDWPPRFDVERRVRVFLPADRARYLAGDATPTELVLAPRR